MIEAYRLLVARLDAGRAGLELPDPPRRHRGRRRRGRPHQERHRHRLAALRRHRRHHPRLADRGRRARDPGRPGAGRSRSRPRLPGQRCPSRPLPHVPTIPSPIERRASPRDGDRWRSRARRRVKRVRVFTTQAKWDARRAQDRRSWATSSRRSSIETAGVAGDRSARRSRHRRAQRRRRAQLVTVKDGLDLPVIAAFRLLAAALDAAASDPAEGHAGSGHGRAGDFLDTLLTAAAQHRLAALRRHRRRHPRPGRSRRRASPCASPTTSCRPPARASSRPTTSPARAAAARCSTSRRTTAEDPRRDRPSQGREDRHHGLHRERPRRNGRRRFRLRRRRAGQDQPLRRQDSR